MELKQPADSSDPLLASEAEVRASLAQPAKAATPPALTLKKRMQAAAAGLLGSTMVRGLGLTLRPRIMFRGALHRPGEELPVMDEFRGPDRRPLLFALWHGTCFPILHYWRGRGVCVVTSRSADGQILAGILRRLGYQTVHGSSSRGGSRALIDLARFVRAGGDAAIAVDGPRGPREQVKPGIILLAKLTGRPIIPLAASARRFWRFHSWDRFRLPLPLTRTIISGSEPVFVPPDADDTTMKQKRLELEQRMLELQRQTDELIQPRVWGYREERPASERRT